MKLNGICPLTIAYGLSVCTIMLGLAYTIGYIVYGPLPSVVGDTRPMALEAAIGFLLIGATSMCQIVYLNGEYKRGDLAIVNRHLCELVASGQLTDAAMKARGVVADDAEIARGVIASAAEVAKLKRTNAPQES